MATRNFPIAVTVMVLLPLLYTSISAQNDPSALMTGDIHEVGGSVINITSVVEKYFQGDNSSLQKLTRVMSSVQKSSHGLLYYEEDLSDTLIAKMNKVITLLSELSNVENVPSPPILLSLRYTKMIVEEEYIYPVNFLSVMEPLSQIPLVNHIAFEFTEPNNFCGFQHANRTNIIRNIKRVLTNCVKCKKYFKIGYAEKHDLITCAHFKSNVEEADFFIAEFHFHPGNDLLESYAIFRRFMNDRQTEIKGHISKESSHHKPLVLYNLQYLGNVVTRADKTYHCAFENFMNEWRTTESYHQLIDRTSNINSVCESGGTSVSGFSMIPAVGDIWRSDGNRMQGCNFFRSIQLTLNDISDQGFHSVLLANSSLTDFLLATSDTCKDVAGRTIPNVKVITGVVSISPINLTEFDRPSLTELETYFGINVTKYSCIVNDELKIIPYPTQTSNTGEFPGNLELCDEIILLLPVFIKELSEYSHWELNHFKFRYDSAKQKIHAKYPSKPVHFFVYCTNIEAQRALDNGDLHDTLYCCPVKAKLTEVFERIISWADKEEITLVSNSHDGSDIPGNPLHWNILKANETVLPNVQNNFPLYVRRSFNKTRMFGKWTKGLLPCLEWPNHVPAGGIGLDGSHGRSYLKVNLTSDRMLTAYEISTLLLFSMMTFRTTQVDISSQDEFEHLVGILQQPYFRQAVLENSFCNREIFINIPFDISHGQDDLLSKLEATYSIIQKYLETLILKLHFSKLTSEALLLTLPLTVNHIARTNLTLQAGLELDDCTEMVTELGNLKLTKWGTEPMSRNIRSKQLNKWAYIVCTISARHTLPENRAEMQIFMETHIYMKTILQSFFPNINEVYFKMVPDEHTATSGGPREFLLLMNHMIEFGKVYNISYILLQSFAHEDSGQLSWWQISNYSDLLNVRAYQDIESTYLRQEGRRPILVEEPKDYFEAQPQESGGDTFWIVSCLGTALVVISITLVAVVVKARKNALLLTDAEVKEFLRGTDETPTVVGDDNDYNKQLVKGGYNDKHEIDKGNLCLDLGEILGKGNFGSVRKASINCGQRKGESVAVKMPLDGCEKQTFIGMLREVMLLGYLGSHPNVVGFIGAYTKEIQKGTLLIVLKLCTGGSLLSHLRDINSEYINNLNDTISMGLVRFCRDIACGMEYISSKSVIHGDLSARNILLDGNNVCKISDFGLSRKLYQYREYSKKTQEPLPWRWLSYESLSKLEFSTMSDVWSFGITAWAIFSLGDVPYPGVGWTVDFVTELKQGMRLSVPPFATPQIYERVATCWRFDPEQRPNFTELLTFFEGQLLSPYTNV